MQPDRVHCSTGLLESPSAGCCVIRRWIRTLTCAQPAHGLPVPSSARSWQTLHTSLSVCLRRKLRLIVGTMSSPDRLEKECWRHPLPGSESTISMPLANAKRNHLVRPAAVPYRDSVANLASQAALTCTFRNGSRAIPTVRQTVYEARQDLGAHERLAMKRP